MLDITSVVEAVFAVIAAIVTIVVVPYINSKTTVQQQENLMQWVKIAVTAAEQIYLGPGRGPEKKSFVVNWLSERGITVDGDRIDAMIEAAVWEVMNHA